MLRNLRTLPFYLSFSTSAVVSLKAGKKLFPVSNKLMSVAVSYLINGSLVLSFESKIDYNCRFYAFILFPCRIIILLSTPVEGMQSWKNAVLKKALLILLTVFVE